MLKPVHRYVTVRRRKILGRKRGIAPRSGSVGKNSLNCAAKTKSGELAKARSTMRALLTLAPLKPTGDRLTGSVVLALMNWI